MHLLRPDHWKRMPPRRKVAWCLGGVVGAVGLWACFWRVPTEVMGKGVLLLPELPFELLLKQVKSTSLNVNSPQC